MNYFFVAISLSILLLIFSHDIKNFKKKNYNPYIFNNDNTFMQVILGISMVVPTYFIEPTVLRLNVNVLILFLYLVHTNILSLLMYNRHNKNKKIILQLVSANILVLFLICLYVITYYFKA